MILLRQKEFVKVPASKRASFESLLGNKKSFLKTGYGKEPIGKVKEPGTKKPESRPRVYWTRGSLPGSKKIQ